MIAGDPYVYPGSVVLKNKFGIKSNDLLAKAERVHVAQRIEEGVPRGAFEIDHLKAIHRHLFQDIFERAGETRTVDLAKGGHHFQPVAYIETGVANIHSRIVALDFLRGSDKETFAREAALIVGDLNYIHPFREGNGRTQLQYLKLLAEEAGLKLDLTSLKPSQWLAASRAAHEANYELMRTSILGALTSSPNG